MREIDFLIVNSYHGSPLTPIWYEAFTEAGSSILFVTPNYHEFIELQKLKIEVLYLPFFFPKQIPDNKQIGEIFRTLGVSDINNYVATEKAYFGEDESYIIPWTYKYLKAFEKIFETYRVKNVLQWMGGEVIRRTCTLLCLNRGINALFIGESFLPGQTIIYTDERKTIHRPKRQFLLDDSILSSIRDSKIKGKRVISYSVKVHPVYQGKRFTKALRLILAGNWNILRAYISHKRKTGFNYNKAKVYSLKYSIRELDNVKGKFFFFPFNVPAESELYIRNPNFIDQVAFVHKLASQLPDGFSLAVKPHPGNEGYMSEEQLAGLKSDSRIILLHESVNTYDIINKSEGVIIVSSTVGLESYLLKKSTAIVGTWPYQRMGKFVCSEVTPELFKQLANVQISDEDTISLLKNINQHTLKGSVFGSIDDFKSLVRSLIYEFK